MKSTNSERLLSLDAFRGITMFLLIAEAAFIYESFDFFEEGTFGFALVRQFHHHPWNGLRFWDLIQPFFMFIVGVAMPFSLQKRLAGGLWNKAFRHILYRCLMLFIFGVGLHIVYNKELVWELWNVLTQLSFTVLITFLIIRLPLKTQLGVSLGLLVLTEFLYRLYDPAGPFIKDQNFGSWVDLILMGKINPGGGWVTINILPTAAHTIWGAICGKVLMSERSVREKIQLFAITGGIGLVIGYGLDVLSITPIIKRIATTSFVLTSGGWCLWMLAFLFWLIDVKGHKNWTTFFVIVGMNPIFIYLFSETIGKDWLGGLVMVFTDGIGSMTGLSETSIGVINAFIVLRIFWYLCYILYKKRIFIKI